MRRFLRDSIAVADVVALLGAAFHAAPAEQYPAFIRSVDRPQARRRARYRPLVRRLMDRSDCAKRR